MATASRDFHNQSCSVSNAAQRGGAVSRTQCTGKNSYIRHLLSKMVESNNVVISLPTNMVDSLVGPGVQDFSYQCL